MKLNLKSLILLAGMSLISLASAAQTDINKLTIGGGNASGLINNDRSDVIRDTKMGAMDIPLEYGKEYDDRLKELDAQMEERKWDNEKSAWERACELNTRDAYQKYADRYPSGLHRGEAENKMVDFDIEKIFSGEFNDLPIMTQTEADTTKQVSVVEVENHTKYELTVLYRGSQNKRVQIPAGGRGSVTVENGYYQIAAFVPPKWIRPYAGRQELTGGRYETGYWVVYGR